MKKTMAGVLAVLAVVAVYWHQHYYLGDRYIARVNGTDFPVRAVDVFVAYARSHEADIDRARVLNGLIENHVLAEHMAAQQDAHHGTHDEAHHADEPGHGHTNTRVGYSEATQFENQLFRLVRHVFHQPLQASLQQEHADNPLAFLTGPLQIDDVALSPMLDVKNRLHHVMTKQQETAAQAYVLGHYRFPDGYQDDITLWDIYQRQNIQLKVQLHEKNYAFLEQAVRQFLATRYALHWFEHHSALNPEEVAAVKRMVREKMAKEAFMHESGLAHDIHDDNPVLDKVASAVTQQEIQQYYQQNREDFRRVEKVRARHIRLESQQQADQVYQALQRGELDFEAAVRRYSVADDADQAVPGDLGWIDRQQRHGSWLQGIAFVQAAKRVSPPFRSPQTPGADIYWEIVYLDEKVMGYQAPDSEGVRYVASREIARKKIQQQFIETRDALKAQSRVLINQRLL